MTQNKSCFYREYNGGLIVVGYDVSYKMVGICVVRIKMPNGVVKSIIEVRNVSKIRRSWFLISALSRLDCTIIIEDEVKVAALFFGCNESSINLHLLKGLTILCGANH